MSKYSSDSDSDDYKSKKSKRRKHRSSSSSSSGNSRSRSRRNDRRPRKSRSRSRDRVSRNASKNSYRSSRDTTKSKTRRSKSPYKRRRYRSSSRSRSTSRSPSKSYSKSKRRNNRSRSGSRSRSRRSRSRSREYHRSRSRSGSYKKPRRTSEDHRDNGDSSKQSTKKAVQVSKQAEKTSDLITLSSDNPVSKQEQLDDIEALSFVQKSFTSSRSQKNEIVPTRKSVFESKNGGNDVVTSGTNAVLEKRKNETVFHDSIVFEDTEEKIRKWVKKLYSVRQRLWTNNSSS